MAVEVLERRSICFPRNGNSQDVIQYGDPGFSQQLAKLYARPENTALEAVVALKTQLRHTPNEDFWTTVTQSMADILGAQMTFVVKRVLADDQDVAVEMPPWGDPGSCMMAAAFHYAGQDGTRRTLTNSKFHAWGCPCAYMRHDKVFLIPEGLPKYITNNPNTLPTQPDAYIAIPLHAEGKCFAHFGCMWSKDGSAQRKLSWAFTEMLLHTLEDMILDRFLQSSPALQTDLATDLKPAAKIIPHEAVTLAQSLRPYAPSLSHELRTPMQGVVGMLDVMHATVQEAVGDQKDPQLRNVFQCLKENIEVVQDSSRRAVEAADNFVHAADMDLTVPEPAPLFLQQQAEANESQSPLNNPVALDRRPEILVAGSNLPLARPNKRRHNDAFSRSDSGASAAKIAKLESAVSAWSDRPEPSQEKVDGLSEAQEIQLQMHANGIIDGAPTVEDAELAVGVYDPSSRMIAPGLRHTNMRDIFQYVINEGLKMGGRPDSLTAQETEQGEIVEVRSRGSDGTATTKTIEWAVDASVPETMFVDEKDLTKLISCLFLNAVKFTNQHTGHIRCTAKMSQRHRYISIKVADNGPGIPAAFLPKLFKPFSQNDGTITRPTEGLGLGLMVAKGIARKLGGDLMCVKAETDGAAHGTEFEVKVPVIAGETISRPTSPFGSPLPRKATVSVPDTPLIAPIAPPPASPRRLATALQAAVSDMSALDSAPSPGSPKTPTSPKTDPPASRSAQHARTSSPSPPSQPQAAQRIKIKTSFSNPEIDRNLAAKYPLNFLVAEDNTINRKLLVSMLAKFGYRKIHEAHDGAEAVRQMALNRSAVAAGKEQPIDVVLMDLWMPLMDGYEATERILSTGDERMPTVLAVTADVTDGALGRAARVGMKGFMTKPYKLLDLQRLITEYCTRSSVDLEIPSGMPEGISV